MNQQSQKTSSLSPADLPVKRKRGRPRKDENLFLGKKKSAMPPSDSTRKNKESADTSGDANGDMVGQVVTGVIEGSFDAGYLLNVKVGNTDTHLRGVVFLPGRFTPITPANDVAPHVKMHNRKEIPIPILNPQTQLHNSVLPTEQSSEQPTELKTHAPELSEQLPSSKTQTAIPNAPENQSASVVAPLAAVLPKNDAGPSLGGNELPQQTLEPVVESLSASIMAQPDHDKVVEHDEFLQKSEASTLIKGHNVDVEAAKEPKAELCSEQVIDIVPGVEIVPEESQIECEAVSLDHKQNDEVESPNLEFNQSSVFAEPRLPSSEQVNAPRDVLMGDQAFSKKDTAQDMQSELATMTPSGTDLSLSNGSPATDPANVTKLLSHTLPQDSRPAILPEGELIPSKSKPAPEESVLTGIPEPQICSSETSGNTENAIKDGLTPTQELDSPSRT